MKILLACWLTAIAVLVWLAVPRHSSFDRRWPTALPPAMSLQTFNAARKAAERPAFCVYAFKVHWQPGNPCRIG
ncbi:MAG: hypothetical protein WBG18_08495 [Xanthobacteraceae bacterium]